MACGVMLPRSCPCVAGGAMRRGRKNYELKAPIWQNVPLPYIVQVNVRWTRKKYLGVQKFPEAAKKPISIRGRQKMWRPD